MNRLIRAIPLPVLIAVICASCTRNQDLLKDGSRGETSSQSIQSDDSNSVTDVVPPKSNASTDDESAQAETASDTAKPQTNNASEIVSEPRNERDTNTAGAEEVPNVKGVQERRSSKSALAKGDINFDDLKFDLAKDAPFDPSLITEELEQLDGRNVTLRGYILPSTLFSETNISQFVLVRDNQECCFGPGAALFDCVMIQMVEGNTTDFVTRPVTVAGRFFIDTESYRYPEGASPNGATHLAIFRIEGLDVR